MLFVLPLGLDTFAVSAALGTRQPSGRERLRISLVMSGFETAMPLIGLILGRAIGTLIGDAADYLAIAVLAAVGVLMLVADEHEESKAVGLMSGHGLALFAIGLSISLDELAIGFTVGLIGVSIWLAVVLIGVQAFVAAQVGLRLGGRLSERAREGAERFAGAALIALAVLLGVEQAF